MVEAMKSLTGGNPDGATVVDLTGGTDDGYRG